MLHPLLQVCCTAGVQTIVSVSYLIYIYIHTPVLVNMHVASNICRVSNVKLCELLACLIGILFIELLVQIATLISIGLKMRRQAMKEKQRCITTFEFSTALSYRLCERPLAMLKVACHSNILIMMKVVQWSPALRTTTPLIRPPH